LVRIAEDFTVPLTWLIFLSEKDPTSNVDLYHAEFFHRIPSWHELGMLLSFENSLGYISDPKERGDLIRIGKDTVKSRHIKPTSFRAHRADLLPGDLKSLEDIGILVDATACPAASAKHGVSWPAGPLQPYHPSYEHLNEPGDAKIVMAPLAACNGVCGYLDFGWDKIEPVVAHSLANNEVTVLALSDHVDNRDTLTKTLTLCKEKGAQFVTLTQLATTV